MLYQVQYNGCLPVSAHDFEIHHFIDTVLMQVRFDIRAKEIQVFTTEALEDCRA
jgi:hypothetical protein